MGRRPGASAGIDGARRAADGLQWTRQSPPICASNA